MEYPGSNSEATLQGNEKEVYASKVRSAIPGTVRFKKLKKLLAGLK